ncbi:MAG TPA: HlyD family efflux transporter periplasmic adaptor subunit [Chitinophagaceae bacterium]|nr:HlyD family efflux transporter periplasmic adaptor subunit [Chitinophagaceae bacterium]
MESWQKIYRYDKQSKVRYWFYGIMGFMVFLMFIPWTQNIKAKGTITTLYQDQRIQEMNSAISGRIVKWFVKEGQFVKKGDTLVQLAEIKPEYLDPNLIPRMNQQVASKVNAIQYYKDKVATADRQVNALQQSQSIKQQQLNNKLQQLQRKLEGEQAELTSVNNDVNLSKDQFERQQRLYEQGLVSQTQLQQRNQSYQQAVAKKVIAENKIAQTQQEINTLQLEQVATVQEYSEKISKAQGEQFQSMSQIANSEGDVAKLENQTTNYALRNGMYFILASQDGQIVRANKGGLGEVVKEGEKIASIVPKASNYCAEIFIRPVDLPLIQIGQKVRLLFDGFPAIVFSGWPENSYGTFGGRVVAYEHTISENGLFRVLVAQDPDDRPWPQQLKMGSGAQSIALLKDVPIWYELWRNINGFPPDYYTLNQGKKQKESK